MQPWTLQGALQGGREEGENDCRQFDSQVGQMCVYQLRLKRFWHRDYYWSLLHLIEGLWAYRHNLAWNLFKNHVKSNGKFWNPSRCSLLRKNWFLRSQWAGSDISQMITAPNLTWDCSAPTSLSWHIRTHKPTSHKEALDGFLAFI